MVEISALDVVVSRNSENLDVLFFVDFDSLRELCSVLFKCHLIASNLENQNCSSSRNLGIILLFSSCYSFGIRTSISVAYGYQAIYVRPYDNYYPTLDK